MYWRSGMQMGIMENNGKRYIINFILHVVYGYIVFKRIGHSFAYANYDDFV
jgi:hypothetical protein